MSSRRFRFVLGVAVVIGLVTSSIALAVAGHHGKTVQDEDNQFSAHLIGYNETPAINSNGVGDLSLTIGSSQITYDLTYSGLPTAAHAAHVHFGQPGVAGAVVVFLCGGGGKPACPPAGGEVTGTITAADVLAVPSQGFAAGDFASLVRAIQAGVTYVNVHTTQFPGGEIRGQIGSGQGQNENSQD